MPWYCLRHLNFGKQNTNMQKMNGWVGGYIRWMEKWSKSKQYNSHSFSNTVAKPVNLVNSTKNRANERTNGRGNEHKMGTMKVWCAEKKRRYKCERVRERKRNDAELKARDIFGWKRKVKLFYNFAPKWSHSVESTWMDTVQTLSSWKLCHKHFSNRMFGLQYNIIPIQFIFCENLNKKDDLPQYLVMPLPLLLFFVLFCF